MPETVEYYISKGCDEVTAKYYATGRKKVVGVVPNEDFTLLLSFDNGEKRVLDVKPMLEKGGVFTAFRNIDDFRRVYLDKSNSTVSWDIDPDIDSNVVWSNKVDLCSDSCYIDSVPLS